MQIANASRVILIGLNMNIVKTETGFCRTIIGEAHLPMARRVRQQPA
jgi:hypothetical protein